MYIINEEQFIGALGYIYLQNKKYEINLNQLYKLIEKTRKTLYTENKEEIVLIFSENNLYATCDFYKNLFNIFNNNLCFNNIIDYNIYLPYFLNGMNIPIKNKLLKSIHKNLILLNLLEENDE